MTLLEMTLIGIIAEKPCHAYQVEKLIEKRGIRERLDIGFSSIYSTLKKLQKKGLLESYFAAQKNLPGRRVYSTTVKGKRAFIDQLKIALSQPHKTPSLFETGLNFSHSISHNELKQVLSLYEGELTRLIQKKVREITNLKYGDTLKRAMLDRPLRLWQTEREWVKELMTLL